MNGEPVFVKSTTSQHKIELPEEDVSKNIEDNLKDLASMDERKALLLLVNSHNEGIVNNDDSVQIKAHEDKTERKRLHQTIRQLFPFLESEMIKNEEGDFIKVFIGKNSTNFHKRRKIFPDENKRILNFTLKKTNLDTINAINVISKVLHRNNRDFKFAGTKDKRGVTCQKCSIDNTLPIEVENAVNSKFWDNRIIVSDFELSDQGYWLKRSETR